MVVSNQETVISHISSSPVTPSAQSASAFSDHITAELRRYEEQLHDVCGLAEGRLREPDVKIQRYQAPDSLVGCLNTL